MEVQPPCLGSDCVVDAHLDPIAVQASELGIGSIDLPPRLLLQTSPESAMKRMLAAGAPAIYSIGPVFRAGEHSRLHNAEFTMLEWYDVPADLADGIELLGQLACEVLQDNVLDYEVANYRDVFRQHVGLDPLKGSLNDLAAKIHKRAPELATTLATDRDGMLEYLMSEFVQPELGRDKPTVIKNYPLSQAALANVAEDDPECAARFELFVAGIELANGYDELTDPDVFLQRAKQQNEQRLTLGKEPLLAESKLYKAMCDGLPKSCGVALGVDRLLMLVVGAESIADVIPITMERC